jgi:energy-converting hydrogenase Eha subunit F
MDPMGTSPLVSPTYILLISQFPDFSGDIGKLFPYLEAITSLIFGGENGIFWRVTLW